MDSITSPITSPRMRRSVGPQSTFATPGGASSRQLALGSASSQRRTQTGGYSNPASVVLASPSQLVSSGASSPPPQSQNIVVLLQQLQEAKDALSRSEARREVVEDENKRLRSDVLKWKQQAQENLQCAATAAPSPAVAQLVPEVISGPPDGPSVAQRNASNMMMASLRQELQSKDVLISELQKGLTGAMQRNTKLEGEFQDQHKKLRHQFEAHVDRLELEIRRGKARQSSTPSAAFLHQQQPAGTSATKSMHASPHMAAPYSQHQSPPYPSIRRDLL
jgi:hypothetical protein